MDDLLKSLSGFVLGVAGTIFAAWLSRDKNKADTLNVMNQTISDQAKAIHEMRTDMQAMQKEIEYLKTQICPYLDDCERYAESRT